MKGWVECVQGSTENPSRRWFWCISSCSFATSRPINFFKFNFYLNFLFGATLLLSASGSLRCFWITTEILSGSGPATFTGSAAAWTWLYVWLGTITIMYVCVYVCVLYMRSDTGMYQPESGIFAELINIGAVCGKNQYRTKYSIQYPRRTLSSSSSSSL